MSDVIVLFDFIEERTPRAAPLEEALLDAGILRLRPVLIAVGATVIALFPLAARRRQAGITADSGSTVPGGQEPSASARRPGRLG